MDPSRFLGRRASVLRRWSVFSLLALSGCAGGSRGCSSLEPASRPIPVGQQIAGGMQLRVSKSALDKVVQKALGTDALTGCVPPDTVFSELGVTVTACDASDCAGGKPGCPIYVYTSAKQRPSASNLGPPFPPPAANDDDGKDAITYSFTSATTVTLDAKLDAFVPVHVAETNTVTGDTSCYLYAFTSHTTDDTAALTEITAPLTLGIDPTTKQLSVTLGALSNPALSLTTSGCGGLSQLGPVVDAVNTAAGKFFVQSATTVAEDLVQQILPKPPGVEGALDLSALSAYSPPSGTLVDFIGVLGGYASTKNGGLNFGIVAGANGHVATSAPTDGGAGAPASCAATLPSPDLGAAPLDLPGLSPGFFQESAVPAFNGNPAPTVGGAPADVVLGASQASLNLLGAEVARSGALCLGIGGGNLPSLTTGALSVLVDSTGTLFADRRAPLVVTLRPTANPSITLGAGTAQDPFLHLALPALGVDVHTDATSPPALSATMDLGATFDIGTTPASATVPGLEPVLLSAAASNVAVTHTDAAMLSADPDRLSKWAASLGDAIASILAGRFTGPMSLPSLDGYAAGALELTKVQTSQDAFLSIAATVTDVAAQTALDATVSVASLAIPDESHLRSLYDPTPSAAVPTVTVSVGPANAEYSYRIDGSPWHAWTTSSTITVTDPVLRLQGHHSLDARARTPSKPLTEDLSPAHLDFIVDSVPPELHPALDATKTLLFGGYDMVTLDANLVYAWNDVSGKQTAFGATSGLSVTAALAITNGGATPLVLFAKDEAGNIGSVTIDVLALLAPDGGVPSDGGARNSRDGGGAIRRVDAGIHGPGDAGSGSDGSARHASGNDSGGCGCRTAPLGDAPRGAALAGVAIALMFLQRRRSRFGSRQAQARKGVAR